MAEKAKILIFSTAYLPYIGGSELAIKSITDRIGDFEFHLITAKFDPNLPSEELFGDPFINDIPNTSSLREMRECGICEGYFDRIALWQEKYKNVVH